MLYADKHQKNTEVCVFIHGYGGNNTRSYWGNLLETLITDDNLYNKDLCFWKYSSSKNPFANVLHLLNRGKKISALSEVANNLKNILEEICNDFGYKTVKIVGHSMGGLVSLIYCNNLAHNNERLKLTDDARLNGFCMLATPTKPPRQGKILSRIAFGNPHLKLMYNANEMNILFNTILPNLLTLLTDFVYMWHTRDELLNSENTIDEMYKVHLDVEHTWFNRHSHNNFAYRSLAKWVA